ncbi:hypothetical protein LZZ85_05585 [Terrimonas sp. NA20]|uniref:Uncharacterized protein n=1 Tax=Terrimonas ginsenosidimutans TaxID=2908004 RepID=A0ABS9KN62_9BACT|nr:hypothetical protein [Terrimonas ginsenosidimutans]MCG2613739.1 hypothetical protein [Terrimonas ginsenosidimutans]
MRMSPTNIGFAKAVHSQVRYCIRIKKPKAADHPAALHYRSSIFWEFILKRFFIVHSPLLIDPESVANARFAAKANTSAKYYKPDIIFHKFKEQEKRKKNQQ